MEATPRTVPRLTPLNARQQAILTFLRDYHAEHHYPPTFQEIRAACGISSTSMVSFYLLALEEMGYIKRLPAAARAIRVL